MTPTILYEDNHLLCIEKPVNMAVQADSSKDLDLLTALKDFIKVRDQKPGKAFLALVHRLDRPVGGAMVFAKTSKAASRLAKEIQAHRFKRTYLAITHGKVQAPQASLEDYLWKNRQENQSYVVSKNKKGAKLARLSYQLLDHQEGLSLLKVDLETGRSHQIRVQLSYLGHPIWGDQKYGADLAQAGQQIALWARDLSFSHPTQDKVVQVQSLPSPKPPWYLFDPDCLSQ